MNNRSHLLNNWFVLANILAALVMPNSASASSTPQVAAGSLHSLALDSSGNVYFWGSNGGITPTYKVPTKIPNLSNIIAISAADSNSLALRADGAVFQLNSTFPNGKLVAGLPTATAISQGPLQAFAITITGDVWSWGSNTNCELGLGITQDSYLKAPAKMPGLSNIVSITAGDVLNSAADSSGNIYVWGCLPDSGGGYIYNYPTPTQVKSLKSPKTNGLANIALDDAFAVGTDGTLWAWNGTLSAYLAVKQNPNLLTNASSLDPLQPVAVPDVKHVARISSDPEDFFLYLIYEDGTAGRITLLVPDLTDISKWGLQVAALPAPTPSTSYVQIAVGQSHIIALQSDGTVVAWGANDLGQLGDGTTTRRNSPVSVMGLNLGGVAQNHTNQWTGLWWNENESGWGMSLTQQGSMVFVAWYTYDPTGKPVWMVMSSCPLVGSSCTGDIYSVTGGTPLGVPWNGSGKVVTKVGTGTLTFADDNTGTFSYSVNGANSTKNITRQEFASGSSQSAVDYTALWWNENESGWGVALTQQYGTIFATMYSYDASGNPVWYVASNCAMTGDSCTGDLYQVTGGTAPTVTWNGANKAVTKVGSISFAFSDSSTGTMTYTINGMTGSKAIARQLF